MSNAREIIQITSREIRDIELQIQVLSDYIDQVKRLESDLMATLQGSKVEMSLIGICQKTLTDLKNTRERLVNVKENLKQLEMRI